MLGTIKQQEFRITRLIYLLKEVPQPPQCTENSAIKMAYTYAQLDKFESGEGELLIKL
jgi:hypothetical protein